MIICILSDMQLNKLSVGNKLMFLFRQLGGVFCIAEFNPRHSGREMEKVDSRFVNKEAN